MISIDEKTSSHLGHLISLTTLRTLTFVGAFEVDLAAGALEVLTKAFAGKEVFFGATTLVGRSFAGAVAFSGAGVSRRLAVVFDFRPELGLSKAVVSVSADKVSKIFLCLFLFYLINLHLNQIHITSC